MQNIPDSFTGPVLSMRHVSAFFPLPRFRTHYRTSAEHETRHKVPADGNRLQCFKQLKHLINIRHVHQRLCIMAVQYRSLIIKDEQRGQLQFVAFIISV